MPTWPDRTIAAPDEKTNNFFKKILHVLFEHIHINKHKEYLLMKVFMLKGYSTPKYCFCH